MTYTAAGQRAVEAESAEQAASIFAERQARKTYGRRGTVYTVRRDSWAQDGSSVTFEVFICRSAEGGGYSGRNVWITVCRQEG